MSDNELIMTTKTDIENMRIDIFSINGHRVWNGELQNVNDHAETILNFDGLSGLYIIRSKTSIGQTTSKIYIP